MRHMMMRRLVPKPRPALRRRLALTVALVATLTTSVLTAGGASAAVVPATKVLVFIEENHSLAQMRTGMPFTFSLAQQYGYATNYAAIRHPSLPNYLAIAGGSTFGVADDRSPAAHPINTQTVFGQARARGRTAKTYAESASTTCDMKGTSLYAVRHNPGCTSLRQPSGRAAPATTCPSAASPVTSLPARCRTSDWSSPTSATTRTTARWARRTHGSSSA